MDAESYIFAEAPYFSDYVYVKFEGAHFDVGDVPLRSHVLRSEELTYVLHVRSRLMERGIFVNKITAQEFGDYALSLDTIDRVRLGRESHLRINKDVSVEAILGNLDVAFEQENFTSKLAAKPESLEYIDLRFEDKIFFKFK